MSSLHDYVTTHVVPEYFRYNLAIFNIHNTFDYLPMYLAIHPWIIICESLGDSQSDCSSYSGSKGHSSQLVTVPTNTSSAKVKGQTGNSWCNNWLELDWIQNIQCMMKLRQHDAIMVQYGATFCLKASSLLSAISVKQTLLLRTSQEQIAREAVWALFR